MWSSKGTLHHRPILLLAHPHDSSTARAATAFSIHIFTAARNFAVSDPISDNTLTSSSALSTSI
jgi:hypothetical protein